MPVPKEVVDAQLNAFCQRMQNTPGLTSLIRSKEVAELPSLMHPGEAIHAVTSGTKEGAVSRWLLVLTDRRILSLDKSFFGKLTVVELPLDSIQGVSHSIGIMVGEITIATAGPAWRLTNVFKTLTAPFATALADLLNRRRAVTFGVVQSAVQPNVDVVGQLERLAQLRTAGHLSDAEFEAQKQRLLSGR